MKLIITIKWNLITNTAQIITSVEALTIVQQNKIILMLINQLQKIKIIQYSILNTNYKLINLIK